MAATTIPVNEPAVADPPSNGRDESLTHAAGVYEQLRQALVDGTIAPGSRMVEARIATQLGVSRTPVREALRRLQSDGFVQQVRSRGLIVTPMGPDDIGDVGILRVEFDSVAARLAAARATARDWDMIFDRVDRLAAVEEYDEAALSAAHLEVHRAIYAAGFSPRLASFFENHLLPYLEVSVNPGVGKPTPTSSHRQHLALVRALSSGDIERAVEAARQHARSGAQTAAAKASKESRQS